MNVIVTGGSSGIGAAIVRYLVKDGNTVIYFDLNESHELNELGAIFYECDVSDERLVESVINQISNQTYIDTLVNNAGVAHIGNIEKTTSEDFLRIFKINVEGVFNCSKSLIPHMKRKGGHIINISSVAAHVGISDRFAYSMSKGAVMAMTYSIAKDYISYGIRCNTISPGRVHTPFVDGFIKEHYPGNEDQMFSELSKTQPIGRMAKPEEVANMVDFLASPQASFITGTDFPIDGGFIKLNTQ